MSKLFLLAVALCFLTSTSLYGQKSIWKTKDAYLGQKPPGDTPEVFGAGMLAKADTFAFDRVAFSDDGTEFYFPTNNTWFSGVNDRVCYMKFENGKWNGPFVLNAHYYAPTFSVDNQTLYFLGGQGDGKHSFVWQSHRTATGWSAPEVYLKKSYGLYDFMPTSSGTCYAGSNVHLDKRGDYQDYDISELKMSATDTTIRSIGEPLNTPGFDGDFFVARDESYIVISAKEQKDYECELWISFHKKDGSWTAPVSLGPKINDGPAHRWGEYVTPDGKYLIYSTGHSPKDCHLAWVRFDHLLEKLKKESL
ncbi:hypothetical protein ACPPVU_10130 [Mucilaginibacter sp. McL0603]|uniref:hypothetical protein n=1 Tax=Mucilaginibacter sp. McL0603 TaxID=3415670 RepID=UPI003CE68978